ncbi:hypothetical protein [Thioflexithrix psekupsensis]|uniref:Uncharacterized protein n=1 Tax=Thioflexithrix psekupsensis TaxID=1570016 RepID=A0A251XAY1_9GAMM|nr:hypothetical protein [Thioflexithrix psekupsensis]OUD15463.1 hypothetical protein TPSD3_02755 [Thioflexithrix psekupsensis]
MKELPKSWQTSDRSIRAVQLAFEFNRAIADVIREEANRHGVSSSTQIRAIIGLPSKKPKRPRLTVTLSEEDYHILAERYQLPVEDRNAIREAIAQELITHCESVLYEQNEEMAVSSLDEK